MTAATDSKLGRDTSRDTAIWTYEATSHRVRYRGRLRVVYEAFCLDEPAGFRVFHTQADINAIRRDGRLPKYVGVRHNHDVYPHEFVECGA